MSNVLTQLSDAISDSVRAAAASIVRVDGARRSAVSGIAWSEDLVVTAAHAIRHCEGIRIGGEDETSLAATLVAGDGGTDIALLRVERAALRPIRWSDRAPRTGELVVVSGRPGKSVRAAMGMISASAGDWRTFDGSRIDLYIDVDGSLPRGFSGGPLIDSTGGAIGMNTSRIVPGGTTIPHATVRRIVDELQRHGSVRRPLIGIGVYPVEDGLLVMSIKPDSSAARAGILVGDVVQAINGKNVRSQRDLNAVVQTLEIGAEIEIAITRGGEARTLRVTVGEG
ncbi:MAG TPA: S1C family serine protease [Thermoanaerobaculia bacterium]|nr:S1C family serine protease [Thermoanaerobaculia bacterium]